MPAWWLHRSLLEQDVVNIVADSAGIEVNRHARRANTHRLDGDKLLPMLRSVLHEPSAGDEDARRAQPQLPGSVFRGIGP